jgi:hypothetical protein
MNTSFFLLDLLVNRTEQRGSWMRFDKPAMNQLMLLDPTLLSWAQQRQLLNLYTRIQLTSLPSLLCQLGQVYRRTIDTDILRILGVTKQNVVALATESASAARESISELVTMMRGDRSYEA